MAHRASTWAFQRFLSCAAVRTSLQDCHPALDLSFSTVRRQVVFGRPLFLLPSGVHIRAVTQSLSGCCLRMCPMNLHLLLLTSSLNFSTLALSSSSLLLILSCHLIFRSVETYLLDNTASGFQADRFFESVGVFIGVFSGSFFLGFAMGLVTALVSFEFFKP